MKPCNQCGKCCIKYADGGLVATPDEIAWWEATRPDIAAYTHNGEIWVDPETTRVLTECPWLQHDGKSYHCQIYLQRPEDCRQYPADLNQMVLDDCEMIELRDLDNPHKAQLALHNLMVASRPT